MSGCFETTGRTTLSSFPTKMIGFKHAKFSIGLAKVDEELLAVN